MRLVVLSHKPCWRTARSRTGIATDGGFAFQMAALAGQFGELRVLVPVAASGPRDGEICLEAQGLEVVPLTVLKGTGLRRKLRVPFWFFRNLPVIIRELLAADAVHAPIPGDIGTVGMLLAWIAGKPLLVRHCGNWLKPVTVMERFWRWFMESAAGGRNVMLATGGDHEPPSRKNRNLRWIFSTSLTARELKEQGRSRQAPPSGSLRLIHVGRQDSEKGAGTIIRAIPLLMEAFPQIRLDIVGDGRANESYRRLSRELGIESRVFFHGKLNHEEVLQALHRADLFCFPTPSEGFPKAVLEALATGLPVVATKVSVLPVLLGNGNGVLMKDGTPEALVEAVRECLATPERYEAMSLQAVRSAAHYSLEAWASEIGDLCERAWGRPLAAMRQRMA